MTRAAALASALAALFAAGGAFAQAEQAPESPEQQERRELRERRAREAEERQRAREEEEANLPVPPSESGESQEPPKWNLGVGPRLSILLGDSAAGVPQVGYGVTLRLHFSFLKLGPLRLGAGFHFAHDRFSGAGATTVAHSTFAVLAVIDGLFGRVRPWLGVGGGFSLADYQGLDQPAAPPPMRVDFLSVVPLVTVAAGVAVRLYAGFELGLRADFDLTFSSQAAGVPRRGVFSPGLVGLTLDLGFRF
ncbi:MAG TPA: hypothetical protein VFF06_28680 [Polyangia bacterium]|nr:hypothetical protein [Polyangia bacterium]